MSICFICIGHSNINVGQLNILQLNIFWLNALENKPAVPNHVPQKAKSMQVFIPTNHNTSWFHSLVPSSLVECVLIS